MAGRDYAKQNNVRNPYNDPRRERARQREREKAMKEEGLRREREESVKKAQESGMKVRKFLNRWTISGTLDAPFVILTFILLCIGLVMMFSAGYTDAYYRHGGDELWYIKKQAAFAVAGIVIMFLVSRFNYKRLNGLLAFLGYGGSVLLLIITFLVNLHKDNDFKRWLKIGPINFQPSELAKFGLILFLAYNIARQYGMIGSKKVPNSPLLHKIDDNFTSKCRVFYKDASTMSMVLTLWYTLIISVVCALIIIENHISCTILVFLIGVGMMWLGGVKKGYFVILAAFVALAVIIVIKKPDILPGYAGQRIIAWLDKGYDPLGKRWQTNQSLRAIASGGPFGLGLGGSRQKHMYVSEPQNDFIFAIICEELGFVGAIVIICLFAALVFRAFRIAVKAKDVFGSMLAMGIALQVGIQVILNIAVVSDAIPNTGISLPFFSYGGSSLVILLAEMGLILSVSRNSSIEKT